MKDTWSKLKLANGYRKQVVRLHGVPKDIVSHRDASWEDQMDLIEFSYKNNYHTSIGMTPFEALYGRRCRSPICWDDSAEAGVLGPDMKEKLSQKYIGPYEIIDRVGEVAYRLALPPVLDRVYNVFHVSQLWKYVTDASHVLEVEHIELDEALTYVETPKEILDRKVCKKRNGETVLLKVLWSNHKVEEAK
ncbi:uncharacterized protein LOC141628110 [Silene latifolia]|uniref:uncharacterized protein LOC141628110 n=1 Tax=Silene latifolia TaxID=37657 RepID=UPI003D786C0F